MIWAICLGGKDTPYLETENIRMRSYQLHTIYPDKWTKKNEKKNTAFQMNRLN